MKIKNKPPVSSSSLPGGSLPRIPAAKLDLPQVDAVGNRRIVITPFAIQPPSTAGILPLSGRAYKIRCLFFAWTSGAANNTDAVILTFANNLGITIVHALLTSASNTGSATDVTCSIGAGGDWAVSDGLTATLYEIPRQGTLPDVIWPAGYTCTLSDQGGGAFTRAVAAVEYYPDQT